MDPLLVVVLVVIVAIICVAGIATCAILLRGVEVRRADYEEWNLENGRPLMVIQTDERRYSVAMVKFALALLVPITAIFLEVGMIRSAISTITFIAILALGLLNVVLDARDSGDLIQYGLAHPTKHLTKREAKAETKKQDARVEARDAKEAKDARAEAKKDES